MFYEIAISESHHWDRFMATTLPLAAASLSPHIELSGCFPDLPGRRPERPEPTIGRHDDPSHRTTLRHGHRSTSQRTPQQGLTV